MLTASAFVGHIIAADGQFSWKTVVICLAVFVLASGAAIVNNIQDRHTDKQMQRTCNRPLASQKVTTQWALLFAGLHFLFAALLIYPLSQYSITPAIVCVLAVLLYNGIYTPLKPKTIWAIIPGSLCGVLPPLIGWYATGIGGATEQIVLVSLILWIWQFPHFWLKMMSFSHDYLGKETLLTHCSTKNVDMFIAIWTVSWAILILITPLYGVVHSETALGLVGLLAFSMVSITLVFLFKNTVERRYQHMFVALNCALLFFMSITATDRIVAYGAEQYVKTAVFGLAH